MSPASGPSPSISPALKSLPSPPFQALLAPGSYPRVWGVTKSSPGPLSPPPPRTAERQRPGLALYDLSLSLSGSPCAEALSAARCDLSL